MEDERSNGYEVTNRRMYFMVDGPGPWKLEFMLFQCLAVFQVQRKTPGWTS